jgi:predicted nucleic acid-binding Zn ribbon protein
MLSFYAVTPAHLLMPSALAAILRKAPLTPEKVAFTWRAAVGPAVDNATTVELRDNVLWVRAKDAAWRREVERSSPLILARLQALLGTDMVRFIDVKERGRIRRP